MKIFNYEIEIKFNSKHIGYYAFIVAFVFMLLSNLWALFMVVALALIIFGAVYNLVMLQLRSNELQAEIEAELARIARAKVVENGGHLPDNAKIIDEKTERRLARFKRNQKSGVAFNFMIIIFCSIFLIRLFGV